jgi:hypothetical protein
MSPPVSDSQETTETTTNLEKSPKVENKMTPEFPSKISQVLPPPEAVYSSESSEGEELNDEVP